MSKFGNISKIIDAEKEQEKQVKFRRMIDLIQEANKVLDEQQRQARIFNEYMQKIAELRKELEE